jgi:hypothetical protein
VVGAGVLLGIAGALASARMITGLLFGIGPADPLALLAPRRCSRWFTRRDALAGAPCRAGGPDGGASRG